MSTTPQKPIPPNVPLDLGEPYCGACGHRLTGLVDSSKCPECGRPIVEVITRAGKLGRRYRSSTTLFGLPIVDVAIGATHSETRGSAHGIFAIGDRARGIIAIGNRSVGIVAIGGRAFGVFALGGIAIGLVSSCGGISIGALAVGGLAFGLLGYGGISTAIVADGGVCIGLYVAGALPIQIGHGVSKDVFEMFTWFFGRTSPVNVLRQLLQPWAIVLGLPIAATAITAALTHIRRKSSRGKTTAQ
ncbi:MAG: hypothetical protein KC983_07770 [Phycisphaerales bacterium]|nr:hypothetical protein [Phycisphaerales bacterium]